jgi:hypothetical protein
VGAKERQALLARYLDDREIEASVRASPARAAAEHGVELEFAQWLAQLEPRRVEAFRRGVAHKARRRQGPR